MIHRVEETYIFNPATESEQYQMLMNHLDSKGRRYELYMSTTAVSIVVSQAIEEEWPTVRSNG